MTTATYPAQLLRHELGPAAGNKQQAPRREPANFTEILEKHDDRLIRDIGLTRDEITGPQGSFWSDREKGKSVWQL